MAVLQITSENFEQNVAKSDKPVLLDFWATWCGPCQMQGPVFEEAAEKFAGQAVFGKVNVDEQQSLAHQFGVMSIPTLILFEGGKAVETKVGFHPIEEIEKMIKK